LRKLKYLGREVTTLLGAKKVRKHHGIVKYKNYLSLRNSFLSLSKKVW